MLGETVNDPVEVVCVELWFAPPADATKSPVEAAPPLQVNAPPPFEAPQTIPPPPEGTAIATLVAGLDTPLVALTVSVVVFKQ